MTNEHDHGPGGDEQAGHQGHGGPGGLLVSEHGYTLTLDSTIFDAGTRTVTFQITGPDGQPVTEFDPTHDKELHLIAVNRDTTGFQHVHPVMDESGTWSTELDLAPGSWRLVADFHPTGQARTTTLGIDAAVGGPYDPRPLPEPNRTAQAGDYTVTLDGDLVPGEARALTLTVRRDGEPVIDLQPYLAAYGHLVALRVGDLGYLHVHPEGEPGDGTTTPGPDITFIVTTPSAGPYRLFLDFQHEDVVRTVEFTQHATGSAPDGGGEDSGGHGDHD
ncbi:hypothetical protein ACFQE5_06520 [Pseudonocardia hispaniensis]|uniref:Secreted protein n=1 Tax=Pseudonocardia hispaniensis TaxID=904933 RepID=A0ABW1J087_9PSEU